MIKDLDEKIRAYALKNALHYGGRANPGSVLSSLFNEGLEKSEVKTVMPKIQKVILEISRLSLEEQKKEFEGFERIVSERDVRVGLPELPNSEKGVVMRFAPAPSGGLHVGHAIASVISYLYVKKYGGKFYIRIEDTNPEKTDKKAYEMIKEDCNWLFPDEKEYVIQSERMKIYYKYVEKLINLESAYVCECSPDEFKKFSAEKKECPCRKKTKEENLKDWKKMLDKKGFSEGQAVLRFKTPEKEKGMQNPNPAMRDFPLARINLKEHPLQGKKYRVWPLMNLAVPVDDIELKMTHIIRGKDHMDNSKRQKMFYEVLGKEKKFPWVFFMGRIKFSDMKLGKRFIKSSIESGEFSGWDDEKLPTLSSLRKRGYNPKAFYGFSEQRGLTSVDKVISSKDLFKILDSFNK